MVNIKIWYIKKYLQKKLRQDLNISADVSLGPHESIKPYWVLSIRHGSFYYDRLVLKEHIRKYTPWLWDWIIDDIVRAYLWKQKSEKTS